MIKTIVYAVGIALLVRTFAFEPFSIPSGSMIPTLLVGDYLFVSKYSYGYSRYSLPLSLPLISGRILIRQPERGDVAVFKLPTDNSTDYIKRIIGLPGDSVQLIDGVLYINGQAVRRERIGEAEFGNGGATRQRYIRYVETLPNGRRHEIVEISDGGPFDNTGVYIVPDGHYFAMGDNRDSSRDSRFLNDVGFVPVENLVGRAEFIFFSIGGPVFYFWQWPETLRLDRFFRIIH